MAVQGAYRKEIGLLLRVERHDIARGGHDAFPVGVFFHLAGLVLDGEGAEARHLDGVSVFELFAHDTREGVDDFLGYDYVAPVWHDDELPDNGQRVGCGALSLRRKAAMIEIAEAGGADPDKYPTEDKFYVAHLSKRGRGRIAPADVAQSFASQNDAGVDPFALRRPWIGNSAFNLKQLLASIQH